MIALCFAGNFTELASVSEALAVSLAASDEAASTAVSEALAISLA